MNQAPAIVMVADTPIGLTVIRDLVDHGVPVICFLRRARGVGRYSRGVARWVLLPADEAEMRAALLRCVREDGARYLIPIGESDSLWCRLNSDAGNLPGLTVLTASADSLRIANDKERTYALARPLGVDVPASWPVARSSQPFPAVRFPCIAKWANPELVAPILAQHGLPLDKCRYFFAEEELRGYLAQFDSMGAYPVVQEYVPGKGLGQMVLALDGEILIRFEHERLAEWPPTGGTSSVCRSVDPARRPELFASTEALIRVLRWTGVAMVEYRHDPISGRFVLMEINGRFWGSLPLARHAGVPFGWLLLAAIGRRERVAQPPVRAGVTCFYLTPELRRMFSVLVERGDQRVRLGGRPKLQELRVSIARFISGNSRPYMFTFRDPLPALVDGSVVAWRLGRKMARLLRERTSAARRNSGLSSA